ncbi:MAG: PIN domain-containing protein [Crocinitomicaceae bacterium]|jgi:predicted nucleic acid-binding protein|nr:PIN domain-containing protein [Crocinitomicaceae bacterium]MDP4739815.1 PIN domain-containing protein [Crocinitomicaceae bacterium]MDP4806555.1 PIN domain-containing protein [Crocinitomicaceae bacterium]
MKSVLIDTDVLLDFYLDRQPFSEDSLQLLLKCEQKQFRAFITPVIVANTYYILRRHATHHYVVERLQILLNIITVLTTDQKQVLAALDSKFTDFEDALQYFSAIQSNKVDVIITRNTKDFKHSKIPVFTPQEYLATLS